MTDGSARPRLLPERRFPAYAYLPGRYPHPLRDPAGHSYRADRGHDLPPSAGEGPELLDWGMDLFNHGFYWEAHEAWEDLWLDAERGSQLRLALKGLILLAAAGVKIREGKRRAAAKHAGRAAVFLGASAKEPDTGLLKRLGIPLESLSAQVRTASENVPVVPMSDRPRPVFDFVLGSRG